MDTKRRFSLILGTYNQEKIIGQLADALNQQTFTDFSIELCDDGSSDSTKEAFEYALHPIFRQRFHYHRQSHRGMRLAKNINQGIKAAEGEYCVFIMGDSFPDPNYLQVLNQFVGPNRMLCGVRYQVDNEIGVDLDWRLKKRRIPPENVLIPNIPYEICTGNGLVIPTEALKTYGGWNERLEGYGGEDNDIVARLYYKGYVFFSIVDAKLYHHWHIAQETDDRTYAILKKVITKYAGL